ncbi:MAG TPA: excinuclease ABC subunit UvrC [Syntrophomonadaceae bacterium]|nr:excinuclease ABC subunit UvrC [Syntrophomonadaceae bacterium]
MKDRLKNVPLKPGVYLYKDNLGEVLYVGKAKALRNRMNSYFQSAEKLHPKVRALMNRVTDFDFIVTNSEVEALILENNLIKSYQPRYNIQLRDDKTYPYLKITTGEKFPRIYITRERKDGVSRYFGPYTDVSSLKETVKLLTSIFPLRTCKTLRPLERPCLNRHIDKCLAPCTGNVSEEEYGEMVASLIDFFEGNSGSLLKEKEAEMKTAASNLEFERAAHLRDQIGSIKKLSEKQKISFANPFNFDLIAMWTGEKQSLILVFKIRSGKIIAKDTFWQDRSLAENEAEEMHFFFNNFYDDNNDIPPEILVGELPSDLDLLQTWLREKLGHKIEIRVPQIGDKKQVLDMAQENVRLLWQERYEQEQKNEATLIYLSKVLQVEVVPKRIECFDVSHLGGQETVGSMVVFTDGIPDGKNYRRFKITDEQNNDTASLSEVISRRFMAAKKGNKAFLPEPDLIIVDGGLGQVNAAYMVLRAMDIDIPVFSLAEKNEEIYRPGVGEPLILSRHDEGLRLLQRLRDEAHRFAINYNRQRRSKKTTVSALDNIEGIGSKRKRSLLLHFGSVAKIREASVEEMLEVKMMNKVAAQNVFNYFRGIKD